MDTRLLIGIIAGLFTVFSGGLLVYLYVGSREKSTLRSLMGGGSAGIVAETKRRLEEDSDGEEITRIKAETKRRLAKKKTVLTLSDKFFQAGMFSEKDKADFKRLRLICPIIFVPIAAIAAGTLGPEFALLGALMGLGWGLQFPFSILDRRILARQEDIMYYLPLVIEQISIGVSSSLDIGPCLQRVVTMADERDTHNVVTELIRHVQFFIKSGVPLEQALTEVGKASGHTELKHAFMSLSQVARHGGEISKQLQELADAVSRQREAKIEEIIKKLELKATGPVAIVFFGFLIIFLSGLFLRLKDAF